MKKINLFNPKVPQKITSLNWIQSKQRFPLLNPKGDADRDGVKNFRDCKPFDIKRQGKKHNEDDINEDMQEEADRAWKKLTPRQKALAQEGLYDY